MSDLAKSYSGKYIFEVLINNLKEFNIEYNIKR